MKQIRSIYIILLLAAFAFAGCKKEKQFKGTDNAIGSFILGKAGTTFTGSIGIDSIMVNVPSSMNLDGAVAIVTLSERATISPDPRVIVDWTIPHDFDVTSANGEHRIYHYILIRNLVSRDGDVTLNTQASVDSLGALNIDRINGSLIIGKTTGTDSIRSLTKLSGLKSVSYDLVINSTYAGKDLTGLDNLQSIGSLRIGPDPGVFAGTNPPNLQTISLPKLVDVYSTISLNRVGAKTVDLPLLTHVDLGINIWYMDALTAFNAPKLQQVLKGVTFSGSGTTSILDHIEFPALTSIGGDVLIANWGKLQSVKFQALTGVQSFTCYSSLPVISDIETPALQTVRGTVEFSGLATLQTVVLGALKSVGGNFNFGGYPLLTDLSSLRSLTNVGGNLSISSLPLVKDDNLSSLAALKTVGGTFTLDNFAFKKYVSGLTSVGTFTVNAPNITGITLIDLSATTITNGVNLSNISTSFQLKGKDAANCSLTIYNSNLDLSNVQGFTQVQNLNLQYPIAPAVQIDQVLKTQQVNGNLSITVTGFKSFSMPQLTTVIGAASFTLNSQMTLDLPLLQSTAALTMILQQTNMNVLSLRNLQTVNGACSFTTGNSTYSVGDIQAPKLKTINGILKIQGQAPSALNTKMTNLNGFSALTSVTGVTIAYNSKLADYTGLKNALGGLTPSVWSVSGNLYNPSLQNMLDGKYTK